jgi:hypothetical protein
LLFGGGGRSVPSHFDYLHFGRHCLFVRLFSQSKTDTSGLRTDTSI